MPENALDVFDILTAMDEHRREAMAQVVKAYFGQAGPFKGGPETVPKQARMFHQVAALIWKDEIK